MATASPTPRDQGPERGPGKKLEPASQGNTAHVTPARSKGWRNLRKPVGKTNNHPLPFSSDTQAPPTEAEGIPPDSSGSAGGPGPRVTRTC